MLISLNIIKKIQKILITLIKLQIAFFMLFLLFVCLFFLCQTPDYYINQEYSPHRFLDILISIASSLQDISFVLLLSYPLIWLAQGICLYVFKVEKKNRFIAITLLLYLPAIAAQFAYGGVLNKTTKKQHILADKRCNERINNDVPLVFTIRQIRNTNTRKEVIIIYTDSTNRRIKEYKTNLTYIRSSHTYSFSFLLDSSYKPSNLIYCLFEDKKIQIRDLTFYAWGGVVAFNKTDLCFCALKGAVIDDVWMPYIPSEGILLFD